MKKTVYTLLVLFIASVANAQDINKIITKDYVDHLIKTLSGDEMQGRRTFTPGIDKAATFIESEFKGIGLKPLAGATGYRQTFYKYQLKPTSTTVMIDGVAVAEENIAVVGNTAKDLSFDQSNSAGWIKLDPEKDFSSQYRTITRSGKTQLVLVDVKFVDIFKRIQAQGSRPLDEKELSAEKKSALVFVLDKDTVTKDFKVEVKNEVVKMPLFNVAGIIPGKSKAKELVIFSGHYDHMGIVTAKNGDAL